jgi:sugar (pentulose or hexulose) kinase
MARSRKITERELVVAIDLGTSACKVVAFDRFGNRVGYGRSPYSSLADSTGRVEQNPEVWWTAVKNAVRISGVGRYGKRVIAYSVSSLRGAILAVDSQGKPLANAILASDLRAGEEARRLAERIGESELYARTGLRVTTYASLARILWLINNKPDVFKHAAKLLGAQDYLIQELTGRVVTDCSQASRTMCFNIHNKLWDQKIISDCRFSTELLPEVVDSGSIIGELRAKASRALDMPIAPVIASGGDQMCAAIGLGGTIPAQVTINHGTGTFIEKSILKPISTSRAGSLCSVHVIQNRWIEEFPLLTAGRALEHLLKILQVPPARVAGLIGMALSDRNRTPGGCLLFLPYQAGSTAPHWNPKLSGAIWGLKTHHNARSIVRSFFESIAFDLRRCIQKLKDSPREISVGGRLSTFHDYNQLQADILDLPVVCTTEPEATALGSAILAFAALRLHASAESAAGAMVRHERASVCRPRRKQVAMYQQLFGAQEKILRMDSIRSKGFD